MIEAITGAEAVAYGAKLAKPGVVAAYPITPQSHITERISKFVADGEMDCQYVNVDSEFSAISCVVGASATGARTFTATASQGVALMHEVLFAAAGMRLPIVMPVANRALSAPINIWNDWQDSISERDNGWVQLYCENAQEALDTTIQAYRVAENNSVLLPTMVNLDGFYLTHTVERVDIPDEDKVDKFLGKFNPQQIYLDPKKPMTQGPFAYPEYYYKIRHQVELAIQSAKPVFKSVDKDYGKVFGRGYGLLEKTKDSDTLIMTMGTMVGNARVAAKELGCGVLKLKLYRPFPREELLKAVQGAKKIVIIEKDVSFGLGSGVLFSEMRDLLYDADTRPKISGWVAGMGGQDIAVEDVKKMVETGKDNKCEWWLP